MIFKAEDVHEYILKSEKDKTDATVFFLKELTGNVSNRVVDDAGYRDKENKFRIKMGESNKIILINCLVGWKNMKNKKGEDVPFSCDKSQLLPPNVALELIGEINRISIVEEEEIKN